MHREMSGGPLPWNTDGGRFNLIVLHYSRTCLAWLFCYQSETLGSGAIKGWHTARRQLGFNWPVVLHPADLSFCCCCYSQLQIFELFLLPMKAVETTTRAFSSAVKSCFIEQNRRSRKAAGVETWREVVVFCKLNWAEWQRLCAWQTG